MTFSVLKIDAALLDDHRYLTAADECYYLGDYLPGEGYAASPVNNLIANLKKPVARRHLPEYRYKEQAIANLSALLRQLLKAEALKQFTLIPAPPSKVRSDPSYDDRLIRVLKGIAPDVDAREAIECVESKRAHHEFTAGERRPTPTEMAANMRLVPSALAPVPLKQNVILFDDVLTNGTHFVACKRLLLAHRPELRVAGLFVGRTKRRSAGEDFEDLDL